MAGENGGGYTILLEGHDISHLIAANGVEVSFSEKLNRRLCEDKMWASYPTVRLTLAAGTPVDLDLPNALVETFPPGADGDAS